MTWASADTLMRFSTFEAGKTVRESDMNNLDDRLDCSFIFQHAP